MPTFLTDPTACFLAVLVLAGAALVWEARTGRFGDARRWGGRVRVALFFAAAVAGGVLLYRAWGGSVLLGLSLVPVTGLSAYRLTMLARSRWPQLAPVVVAAAVALGVAAGLQVLPPPTGDSVLFEQLGGKPAPSANPDAGRVVRA